MTEYQKYPEYKDSGVEWLGEVPSDWEVVKLRKTAELISAKKRCDDFTVALENIASWTGDLVGDLDKEYESEGVGFKSDDILFGKLRPYLAKVFLANRDGSAVGDFYVIRSQGKLSPQFLRYALVSPLFISLVNSSTYGAKMPRVGWSFMGNIQLPIPPLETQQKIVEFLDGETAHIDAGVANMEALIALLSEKRAALISETVTRGIPGEHAEFKDSGVEWLGEVPAEWQISQVKDFFTERRERNDLGQEANYLSLMANRGVIPYAEKGNIGNKMPEDLSKTKKIHNGDFVINSMNYGIGSFGASAYDGVCSNVYVILTPRPEVYNKFAYLLLSNMDVAKYAQSFGKGILAHRCAIGWDVLKGIKMPLPPLETQQKIVDFVDTETSRIDEAISQAKSLIQLMKEKRQTLISEVVTGKIDVTGEVN